MSPVLLQSMAMQMGGVCHADGRCIHCFQLTEGHTSVEALLYKWELYFRGKNQGHSGLEDFGFQVNQGSGLNFSSFLGEYGPTSEERETYTNPF